MDGRFFSTSWHGIFCSVLTIYQLDPTGDEFRLPIGLLTSSRSLLLRCWCFVADFVAVGLVQTLVDPNGKPISSERLSPNGKKRRHHDSMAVLEGQFSKGILGVGEPADGLHSQYIYIYSIHCSSLFADFMNVEDGTSLFQSCILREGLVA